jgi:peroxiredoxin
MLRARSKLTLLAGCLLALASAGALGAAEYTVGQVLKLKPRQSAVDYSTPKPEEESTCTLKVETVGKMSGYVLRDAQGRLLRRFFDTVGDGKVHLRSFYKDGVEVYREIDTSGNGRPEQYRWVNSGGTKWGLDTDADGVIDEWRLISPEEVCQELLLALTGKDFARVKALLITDADLKRMSLPDAEARRIREAREKAADNFKAVLSKTAHFTDKTRILNYDIGIPQCQPAEQAGAADIVKYLNVGVACSTGEKDGPTTWIQTGEMIQVGSAWKLIDAPREGMQNLADPMPPDVTGPLPKEIQDIAKEIEKYDQEHHLGDNPAPKDIVEYHMGRVRLVQKVLENPRCPADERIKRIQEMSDGLSAAAQSGDKTAYDSLARLEKSVVESKTGGDSLAAFVTFRELQTRYALDLTQGDPQKIKVEEVQKNWSDRLAKFVQTYPKAVETPEALKELGLVNEFLGKEIDAKNWYQQLAKDFETHPLAELARGCVRRMELDGKPFELTAKKLSGSGQFEISELKGKVVLVYYWASWNQQCVGDFARLKMLLESSAGKGVQLVCVNLDNDVKDAQQFLTKTSAPGIHVYLPETSGPGMPSKLAVQYGIQVLPHMFVVGKDGKVVNRNAQVSSVADEIGKLMK